jgi:hypothetical protein
MNLAWRESLLFEIQILARNLAAFGSLLALFIPGLFRWQFGMHPELHPDSSFRMFA